MFLCFTLYICEISENFSQQVCNAFKKYSKDFD